MLNNKSILVTGGTGSFGRRFIKTVLDRYEPAKIIVYSRDELKQFDMQQVLPETKYPIRYFIGDVRDLPRLTRATEGVNVVIHAAAMKQIPAAEYNPFEAVKTNILGGQNVIDAALASGVERALALSTDKAAAPINLYGATKLTSDKLFIAANNYKGARDIRFSVVRYGNVMGSRGSIIPLLLKKRRDGIIPITDERMTRFNITLQEGVDFVLRGLKMMEGRELYVPKLPSYRILDVAEAVAPGCKVEMIGIRPGEKLHEEMITVTDAMSTMEYDDHFILYPDQAARNLALERDKSAGRNGALCKYGFSYSSNENEHFLSVAELRKILDDDPDIEL